MSHFYDHHMLNLLQPLVRPHPPPPCDPAGRPAASARWVEERAWWNEARTQVSVRRRV